MFEALDISTSGLIAMRTSLDVIAGNIAMRDVTRDELGNPNPFRRKVALLAAGNASGDGPGVHVAQIVDDPTPGELRYDPGHPDAATLGPHKGYVQMSNVDVHTEMVNAMTAVRAYEANLTIAQMAKHIAATAISLLA